MEPQLGRLIAAFQAIRDLPASDDRTAALTAIRRLIRQALEGALTDPS
jgi:hypothetical protein